MSRRRGPRRRIFSPISRFTREGRARRRYNCARREEWDERAEVAVALLATHEHRCRPAAGPPLAIADFGAGNERLRPLLEKRLTGNLHYDPYDLHPQLPTTTRLDVAREMPEREFDVAVCLGLLEYLASLPSLARALSGKSRFVLVSYVTSDSPVAMPYQQRLEHGWKTHLKANEVEAAFEQAGFRAVASSKAEGGITTLWLWENVGVEQMR